MHAIKNKKIRFKPPIFQTIINNDFKKHKIHNFSALQIYHLTAVFEYIKNSILVFSKFNIFYILQVFQNKNMFILFFKTKTFGLCMEVVIED